MKVTVNAEGEVTLDVSNGEAKDALNLIHALQADAQKRQKPNPDSVNTGVLNKKQYAVWEFLLENDCEVGVSINAVERHLGISNGAAGQRLLMLLKLGYAKRVTTGRYRAEIPSETA